MVHIYDIQNNYEFRINFVSYETDKTTICLKILDIYAILTAMERVLQRSLTVLGCDEKQTRLFIASYNYGKASLSELAKAARLQRSTAYVVIKVLLEMGLIIEDHKAYGKAFTAVEPEVLIRMVESRQRQIGRQRLSLEEHLGELQALYRTNEIRPQVRTYQGTNGLVSVWRDVLTAKSEILIWTNQATESKLFNTVQHDQFIAERCRSERFARVLVVDNPAGCALRAADTDSLRETRLLPKGIDFSAETYLYDHKVAVLDYNQDIIGIITESQQIAQAQKAMFETAWQAAQN
jgi:sugar-specific transcriptional regulator TrmB